MNAKQRMDGMSDKKIMLPMVAPRGDKWIVYFEAFGGIDIAGEFKSADMADLFHSALIKRIKTCS